MYTDVYVDVLFLLNFSMDSLSLYITGRLCCLGARPAKIVFSGVIGALYGVISVFFGVSNVFGFFITIGVSFVMVCVAYKVHNALQAVKTALVFFITSSLLGGLMSAMYVVFSEVFEYAVYESNVYDPNTPVIILILGIVSFFVSLFLTRLHGSGNLPESCEAEIELHGQKRRALGIFDTGNLLRDPISGKAVIVVRASCLEGIVSSSFLKGALDPDHPLPESIWDWEMTRFRLVPSKGIEGSSYLYGLVPDRVTICYERKGKRESVERDVVIALMRDTECKYECIVPGSVI